MQQEPILY